MNMDHLFHTIYPVSTQIDRSKHFVVVGAGGTGGYVIRDLARAVSIQNQARAALGQRPHRITVIDADVVELKNLNRQNFIASDLGKNKAEVLANRYGRAFGVSISAIPEYMRSSEKLVDYFVNAPSLDIPVLVDCVDNNATRQYLNDFRFLIDEHGHSVYTISSGNEARTGQVIFSYNPSMRSSQNVKSFFEIVDAKLPVEEYVARGYAYLTPHFFDVFPNIEIDKDPTQLSCAEAAVSAPQNIVTNIVAANHVFSFLNDLLTEESISTMALFYDTQMRTQSTYFFRDGDVRRLLSLDPKEDKELTLQHYTHHAKYLQLGRQTATSRNVKIKTMIEEEKRASANVTEEQVQS